MGHTPGSQSTEQSPPIMVVFPGFLHFPKLFTTISTKTDGSFHVGKVSPTAWQCTSVMFPLLRSHALHNTSSLDILSATTFLLLCSLRRWTWMLIMQSKFVSFCWSYSADFTPSSGFVFLQPWANTAVPMCWAYTSKMGMIFFFVLLMLCKGVLCLTVAICCH